MKILVTGATGNVGRLVVEQRVRAGADVRALNNNPEKAALPAGVEVAEVVAMAVQAGVRRIVTLSCSGADAAVQGGPSGWCFYAIEHAVESAGGIKRTCLRPGQFMTNMLDWAPSIRATGEVRGAYGSVAYSPIDLDDVAAVAAARPPTGCWTATRRWSGGPRCPCRPRGRPQ